MKVIKFSLFILLALFTQCTKSDFVSGSIWQKKMPNGQMQNIVLIGDWHYSYTKQQVDDLISGIKDNSVAIVEDSFDTLPEDSKKKARQNKGSFYDSNIEDIGKRISDQNHTIKVVNIEFRSSALPQFAGILPNVFHSKDFCAAAQNTGAYLDTSMKLLPASLEYNDEELNKKYLPIRYRILKDYFNSVVFKYALHCACIFNKKDFEESYLQSAVDSLMNILARELDVRILHQIHLHKERKNIFVIAGAWHTHNVANILAELGYQNIAQEDHVYWSKDNLLPFRPTSSLNVKQLLSHLPKDDEKEKLEKQAIFSALPLTVAPALKYAPYFAKATYGRPSPSWSYAWRNQKPFSMSAMRSAASQWMRRPLVMPQFRLPRVPFNSMPRTFKIGGIAATGLGLALFNRK